MTSTVSKSDGNSEPTSNVNAGYKAFYRHKEVLISADTVYLAWEKSATILKVPENKRHLLLVLPYQAETKLGCAEDDMKIIKFKIPSLKISDKDFNSLSFGRQIEYYHKIAEWKKTAASIHLSQKRQTYTKAIREFIKLYGAKEYFTTFYAGEFVHDDSFEIFYKVP